MAPTPARLNLPHARAGSLLRTNGHLRPIACPSCKGAEWILSVNDVGELHVECCTCPPGPAVMLTKEHVRAALTGQAPSPEILEGSTDAQRGRRP